VNEPTEPFHKDHKKERGERVSLPNTSGGGERCRRGAIDQNGEIGRFNQSKDPFGPLLVKAKSI